MKEVKGGNIDAVKFFDDRVKVNLFFINLRVKTRLGRLICIGIYR